MIVTKYIILWLKKNWKFENLDVLVLWISLETLFKRYSSCSCRGGVDGFTFYTVLLTFVEDQVLTLSPMWLAVWTETRAIVYLHCTFYIVAYIWTSFWFGLAWERNYWWRIIIFISAWGGWYWASLLSLVYVICSCRDTSWDHKTSIGVGIWVQQGPEEDYY